MENINGRVLNMLRFKIQFQVFAKMEGIDVEMGNELLLITTWPT
jgi:hypothetical protein